VKQSQIILFTLMAVNVLTFAGGHIEPVVAPSIEKVASSSYFKNPNFYVGLGISHMKLDNDFSNESFKAKGIMLQAGYEISDYLAIEARYTHHIGDVEYDHGSDHRVNESVDIVDYPTDFTNIALYLKPSYSYKNMTAYALLGYGEVKLTNIPLGDVDRAEDSFQWGVGAAYDMNEDISLFADYVVFYNDKGFDYRATNANIKVDALTMGLNYRF